MYTITVTMRGESGDTALPGPNSPVTITLKPRHPSLGKEITDSVVDLGSPQASGKINIITVLRQTPTGFIFGGDASALYGYFRLKPWGAQHRKTGTAIRQLMYGDQI